MEVVHDGDVVSDSEACYHVINVLNGVVAMDDSMVDQNDTVQYHFLVSIIEPTQKKGPEEEALLVTALKALTGAISKIDVASHNSLLNNIFGMCIWNYGFDTRKTVLELITSLAAVPDKFLRRCLHMLVSNFKPKRTHGSVRHPRLVEKRNIYSELYAALHHIADLVPLAPMMLKDIIATRMPKHTQLKEEIIMFVECLLGLENDEIGEFLGSTLLTKVVELLVELDVNINWEDILQDEHNKGVFDMELEDVEENTESVAGVGTKLEESGSIPKGNEFADKLDSLMVIVCEHLELRASDGHLVKVFEILFESFSRTVLKGHKLKFVQFVMFYTCSLDPEICGLKFADMLADIFVSNTDTDFRKSSVAYLASYLSRAKFIPSSRVASMLERLVDWCFKYCQLRNGLKRPPDPEAHQVFYSGCQAVMYILCFRMRSLMDVPILKSLLFHLPLEPVLCSSLDPLKVCLATIVQEFLRQAKAAHLFKTLTTFPYDNLLESEFSKAFGGTKRLDMFFPFDPYLLKESDRFMRPNFEFWSMVRTTYSNSDSEDQDEDFDAPEFADDTRPLDDNDNLDLESESDDDLEYSSISRMSITPRPAFQYSSQATSIMGCSQMPVRIRPSISP